LLGIVSFCLKQQYQEACQMHLHLLSSKDDLEYVKHCVTADWFKWSHFQEGYSSNVLTMCLRKITSHFESKILINELTHACYSLDKMTNAWCAKSSYERVVTERQKRTHYTWWRKKV
jgi:hypothetical protein